MKAKVLILFLALPLVAQAQVNYATYGNATAHVTRSWNASGNITIASTYEGYPVTSIDGEAFVNCISLTNVIMPDSVTNIGDYAFESCTSLTNVVISSQIKSIGNNVFVNSGLISIVIPNSVTNIGNVAFASCARLTNVAFGVGIKNIGSFAFAKSGLTSIVIPDSVTRIGDNAFYDCNSLTNVVMSNGVTSIGNGMFEDCTNLTSIVLPDSVTNIGGWAFADCSSLTNIIFLGDAPKLIYQAFVSVSGTIYYYYGTSGWGATYGGLPTVELAWTPQIVGGAKAQSGSFGFTIIGTNGMPFVVEASTNLADWQPVWTNSLSGASTVFTDSQWANYPARFYRAR